jgi:hypothetical protein
MRLKDSISEQGEQIESPRDQRRFCERIEELVCNQEKQLKDVNASFAERIYVDNPDFKDVDELEEIYKDLDNETIVERLKDLYATYESRWNVEGINDLIEKFPQEKLNKYSAKTSNGHLASLKIDGEFLKELELDDRKNLVESLSVLRNLWYSHYGFYDLRLVASYLEYGRKKGLDDIETITKHIEHVSTEENDTYFLVLGGKNNKERFMPEKVLGHIGLVDGMEYPKENGGDLYEPKDHILHVDKLHLSEESLLQGKRIVKEVGVPVKIKNVREITRFMKSPFVPARKQVLVSAVLTGQMVKKFIELQEEDEVLIFADLDRDIAAKNVSQMAIPNSYTSEKFFSSPYKQGLLMPRWLDDEYNLVKTGPTFPLFFTGRDVVEKKVCNGNEYDTFGFLEKIFNTVDNSSKRVKVNAFLGLIQQSITNQLNSIESSYVKVNENGNGNGSEAYHTGQVGGPEGLIKIEDNELALDLAKKYYGKAPNFLPLPYREEGFDFSELDEDSIKRILYSLELRNLAPAKYNLDPMAQITPLGNRYVHTFNNIDSLGEEERKEELENQSQLVKDLLARSKFLPLIREFLKGNKETKGGVNFFQKLKAKYFANTKLKLNDVRKLTSAESILNVQNELFSSSCFLCAGLGTGGMQLVQDLRKSIPVADYILIDHGVVDSDNGHQIPSLNELGASKLAVAVDGLMRDLPIAPWGSKKNLVGGVFGFATPYTKGLDEKILEKIKESGKTNIVLVDEIDVTDGKTILQKIAFHDLAIKLSKELGSPVSVVCGLDLGQTAVWRGNFIYDKDSEPFNGLLNFKAGAKERAGRVSPLILLAPLLIGSKLPTELELLLADMARDGSLEGVGQTVYSSNQSSVHVGNAAVLNSMMQSLGYKQKEMQKLIRQTYVENPMQRIFNEDDYAKYETYSGRDGFLLLPFLLHLSGQIYETKNWPKDWRSLTDPKIAYRLNTLKTALEG